MPEITIMICTYNGQQRLPYVLESLLLQNINNKILWEVLVVDNNSKDKTKEVVINFQNKWLKNSNLRYCFEAQQGLAYARQRGIEEAKSPLIGFIDDDNIPQENWLEEVLIFAQQHSQAAVFGSEIQGDFEIQPPENFEKISSFLAIINRGDQPFIYHAQNGVLPPAAGLVIRRQVWLDCVPQKLFLIGRIGKSMLASEDLEALIYIQQSGYEIWHNPSMKIKHKIPACRLEKEYLLSLIRGIGLARYHIRMLRLKLWQRPLFTVLLLLNDLRKITLFLLKNKGKNKQELIMACELEFLISTIQSPFYMLKRTFIKN